MDARRALSRLRLLRCAGSPGPCALLAGLIAAAGCATPHETLPSPPAARVLAPVDVDLPLLASPTARPYLELAGRRSSPAAAPASAGPPRADDRPHARVWAADQTAEVRTRPLRVTVLALAAGERLVSLAAGDTVRWRIGSVVSGEGPDARLHVLIKPLEAGLATNLVIATSGRLYLVDLRSALSTDYDRLVRWTDPSRAGDGDDARSHDGPRPAEDAEADFEPQGRYRIRPAGRRAPPWTPVEAAHDGGATRIRFPSALGRGAAPILLGRSRNGQTRALAYRQIGDDYWVDEIFEAAELRSPGARPEIVRLTLEEGRP